MTTRAVPPAALTGRGLPPSVVACLFDLDGVLTSTAITHAAAWAAALDEVLRRYARREGLVFVPFDPVADHRALVDGRPRDEGTRTFLAARGVVLAEGGSSDGPGADTAAGVGARKTQAMARLLRRDGLHLAALAGAWTALVVGFGGMRDDGGPLVFAPRLPPGTTRMASAVALAGQRVRVEVTAERRRYTVESGPSVMIAHHGEPVTLDAGVAMIRPPAPDHVRAAPRQPVAGPPRTRRVTCAT